MEHKEAVVKIYFTTEYSRFNMILGNRQLDEAHIKRLEKNIEDGMNYLRYFPIQVKENGEKLDIIDGQHRYYVGRKLRLPIFYIIVQEDRSLHQIAKTNSAVSKWKTGDFIHCYVMQENPHYKELQEFMTVYDLSASLSVRLLTSGDPGSAGGGNLSDFQQGMFEVKTKEQAVALTESCRLFSDFKHWRSNYFFSAIKRIVDAGKVPIAELAEKFQQNKDRLTQQPDVKSYIGTLSIIYNIRKTKHCEII